ncbi:MAG TPA: hypothetical protein VIU15_20455 [Streptomyces sp.]
MEARVLDHADRHIRAEPPLEGVTELFEAAPGGRQVVLGGEFQVAGVVEVAQECAQVVGGVQGGLLVVVRAGWRTGRSGPPPGRVSAVRSRPGT